YNLLIWQARQRRSASVRTTRARPSPRASRTFRPILRISRSIRPSMCASLQLSSSHSFLCAPSGAAEGPEGPQPRPASFAVHRGLDVHGQGHYALMSKDLANLVVFQGLGTKIVPFLPQIMPQFFEHLQHDALARDFLFQQLAALVRLFL